MRFHLKSVAWIGCLAVVASSLCLAAPSDLRLIHAVKSQDVESVRVLLKQHVDVNAAQGDGTTALHWAADLDNLTIADLLIRAGARANAANDLGATPLYLACRNRSVSMVDRLLAAGADANAKLLNGECDSHVAEKKLVSMGTAKQGISLNVIYQIRLRPDASADELVKILNRVEGVQSIQLERRGWEEN